MFGQLPLQFVEDFIDVMTIAIPLNGTIRAYVEPNPDRPAEQITGKRIVCYSVLEVGRFGRIGCDSGITSCFFNNGPCRVDYLDPLHGSRVDASTVFDLFCYPDGPIHNISDVCPVPDLLTRPPYFEWILSSKKHLRSWRLPHVT